MPASGTNGIPVSESTPRNAAVISNTCGRATNWRPSSCERSTAWVDREIKSPVATATKSEGTAPTRPSPIVSRE